MVPAPSGILAVGDGAWRIEAGVVGDATDPVGVTGFMCSPDVQVGAAMVVLDSGDPGGGAGNTFSRWA